MNCEHCSEDWETCTNADCPYCADYCPVTENPEVCRYSGLDDTEMMLRKCLGNEQEDHQQALQALAEENRELRKALAEAEAALYEYQAPIHPIYAKASIDLGKNSQGEEMFIRLSYITSRDLLNKGTAVFLKLNYPREFAKLCEAWPEIKRFV